MNTPEFQTGRLLLRHLREDDQRAIFELRSNEEVGRYIGRPRQRHMDEAAAFIQKIRKGYEEQSYCYWVLELREGGALIGTICLWNFSPDKTVAEIGYDMLPRYQGEGYMQEAVAVVLNYAFQALGLEAVEAYTHRDNMRSLRLLETNGFVLCEGRVDKDVPANVIYSKSRP